MKKILTVMFLAAIASIFTLTAYAATPNTNVVDPNSTINSTPLGFMTAVDLVNDSLSKITLQNNGVATTTLTSIFIQELSSGDNCTVSTLFTAANEGFGILWTNVAVAGGSGTTQIGANYLYNILNLALTYAYVSSITGDHTTPGNNDPTDGAQWCIQLGILNTAPADPIISLIVEGNIANYIPIHCYDPTSTESGYCSTSSGETNTQTFTP